MGLLMYSLLIAILLVQKHCTVSSSDVYSYPSEVKVQVHKDFVYQLNSTRTIKEVRWGLFVGSFSVHIFIFYSGNKLNPSLPAIYKGRLEYFGDWTKGHMWYKLKNVSLSDNGYYGVRVRFNDGSGFSFLKTQLIVTVTPTFTVKPNSITTITEYNDLSIICSATGLPSPTVKWLNVSAAMATVTQGSGSAVLKIPRITRHYNGQRFVCQANNNPNEPPSETTTQLQVNYKPSIDVTSSTTIVESWEGNTIKLKCKWLDGQPAPTWKWYHPNGQRIRSSPIDKGSEVTLTTSNGDYGLYKCQATNVEGNAVHSINVTQLFPPGPLHVTIRDIKASTATVQWSKPCYNGGSNITGYKVEVNKKIYELNAQTFHRHVTGLENGRYYEVKVWSRNVVGYGNVTIKSFKTKIKDRPITVKQTTILPSCTACKQRSTVDKEGTIIALGAVLGVSLILNVLTIGYVIWTHRTGYKKREAESNHKISSENVFVNSVPLQEQPPTADQSTTYEPVDNQGQQNPPHSTTYQSVKPHTDTYSSLSPSTKLPPKPAVLLDSGIYQDLQGSSHQYQSLDGFSRI